MACQPQGWHDLRRHRRAQRLAERVLEAREQLQGVVARIHEGERELLAAGAAHGGMVDGGERRGHGRRARKSTRYKHRCQALPGVTMLSGWPEGGFLEFPTYNST